MTLDPTAPTPTDRATSDPAPLVPTGNTTAPVPSAPVPSAPVPAAPVPSAPVPSAPVSVGEIAQFLRHLTNLRVSGRSDDPAARAAFLARKAELFTRLAADPATPTSPPTPARRTP